ncbi:MAG: glycosyltransferase family 4 protein [Actinobacteria bacterium]|nr:glycosyltransferase family 4 protein [Actinomycetota bacterium]
MTSGASAAATAFDPLRLTIVTSFGSTSGGAELWLMSLLDSLGERVATRVIVLEDGPLAAQLASRGAEVKIVPVMGLKVAEMMRGALAIHADLRRHPPDLVVGNGVKAQAALALPSLAARRPNVWIKHDHSFDALVARPLGRLSTSVVATAAEVGDPVGRADVVVIEPERPPLPDPRDSALATLAEFGYHPDTRPALAIVGRLVPYKGVDVAVRALAYPESEPWRLVVIGGDDDSAPGETDRLRQLAEVLGVSSRVHFCGPVPEAGRLLAGFEALAVLTRPGQSGAPQREGYGITGTEAMLAGLPVVTAGEGPVARRLRTPAGPAGIVVRPADPLATAHALARLADPGIRAEMGKRGRAVAEPLPEAQEVAAAVLESFRGVAGRRRNGQAVSWYGLRSPG